MSEKKIRRSDEYFAILSHRALREIGQRGETDAVVDARYAQHWSTIVAFITQAVRMRERLRACAYGTSDALPWIR